MRLVNTLNDIAFGAGGAKAFLAAHGPAIDEARYQALKEGLVDVCRVVSYCTNEKTCPLPDFNAEVKGSVEKKVFAFRPMHSTLVDALVRQWLDLEREHHLYGVRTPQGERKAGAPPDPIRVRKDALLRTPEGNLLMETLLALHHQQLTSYAYKTAHQLQSFLSGTVDQETLEQAAFTEAYRIFRYSLQGYLEDIPFADGSPGTVPFRGYLHSSLQSKLKLLTIAELKRMRPELRDTRTASVRPGHSLDAPLPDDDRHSVGSGLEDPKTASPLVYIAERSDFAAAEAATHGLSARQKGIVQMLAHHRGTLEEAGLSLGTSRQNIEITGSLALKNLRAMVEGGKPIKSQDAPPPSAAPPAILDYKKQMAAFFANGNGEVHILQIARESGLNKDIVSTLMGERSVMNPLDRRMLRPAVKHTLGTYLARLNKSADTIAAFNNCWDSYEAACRQLATPDLNSPEERIKGYKRRLRGYFITEDSKQMDFIDIAEQTHIPKKLLSVIMGVNNGTDPAIVLSAAEDIKNTLVTYLQDVLKRPRDKVEAFAALFDEYRQFVLERSAQLSVEGKSR